MYRVAIVEDDRNEADTLARLIRDHGAENGVRFSTDIYGDARSFFAVRTHIYDIVFMDIGLPDVSGMDVAGRLRESDDSAVIIFVTSMSGFAVRGYETDALDFIVKPASRSTLDAALKRAVKLLGRRKGIDISVGTSAGLRMLDSSAVHYVEVRDHLIVYHTDDGELTEFGSLRKPEKLLAAHGFVRVSNSVLVNLKCVDSADAGCVRVDGKDIAVSRARAKEVMRALNDYLGA